MSRNWTLNGDRYTDEIPEDVIYTLKTIGNGDPLAGLIQLVRSYESQMEEQLHPGRREAGNENVPPLNEVLTETLGPLLAEDGLVSWDYILASGFQMAIDVETSNLPMSEYDRRKIIIRRELSKALQREWFSLPVLLTVESAIG